jgi:Tol biopolymer transport system component
VWFVALCAGAHGANTQRISAMTWGGQQGSGNSHCARISANGRWVAFVSEAPNLYTYGYPAIIFVDRTTGRWGELYGGADQPSMSSDGAVLAFHEVFYGGVSVWEVGAAFHVVSISTNGVEANGESFQPSITRDGRMVAFASWANNLVAGDTNGRTDIFVHDRTTHITQRVSVSSDEIQANGDSWEPCVTTDRKYVAFASDASNLVDGDTNNASDIFVRDRVKGTTERVSVSSGGAQGGGNSYSPYMTPNGRYVVFTSEAGSLVSGDTNGQPDVFIHDRQTHTTERLSVSSGGEEGYHWSTSPWVSDDGRFAVFGSMASNLVAGDTNNAEDIFLRDRLAGSTLRVTAGYAGGEADGDSFAPVISPDGGLVAYESDATNLVFEDTNGVRDVFLTETVAAACPPLPPSNPYLLTIKQLTNWADASLESYASGINYDGTRVAGESSANLTGENTTGKREVLAINGDGTGLRQLTHGANGASTVVMSGNGEMIAFIAPGNLTGQNADGSSEVFVVSFDGATVRQLTSNSNNAYGCKGVKISHDGQWVCFASNADLTGENADHKYELFVVKTDGTGLDQLTREDNPGGTSYQVSNVFISPDGQRVGFGSTGNPLGRNADHSKEVFIIKRDGTGLAQVTDNPDAATEFDMGQGMTQNGGVLLIMGTANPTGQNPDGHSEVFLVNADGSGLRQMTCDPSYESRLGTMTYDGSLFSFRSQADFTGQNADHSTEAFLMRSDGTRLTQVSRCDVAATTTYDRLTGDGKRIGFTSNGNQTGQNADGGREAFIADLRTSMPPSSIAISINNGASCTNAAQVSLTLYAVGADEMQLRNDPGEWSAWGDYAPAISWMLRGGGGLKKVWLQCRDAAGNASAAVFDEIILVSFYDVPCGHPAKDYVEALLRAGIASGCSAQPPLFCPDAPITRAQMAKFICKAAGKSTLDRPAATFADVPSTHPFYGWIERLADSASWGGTAVTGGCRIEGASRYFCPDQPVTRQEMAKFLCLAAGKQPMPSDCATFADVEPGSPYCGFIERLSDAGSWPGGVAVTSGCACPPGYPAGARCFCPGAAVTRAQMAVFVCRAFGIRP